MGVVIETGDGALKMLSLPTDETSGISGRNNETEETFEPLTADEEWIDDVELSAERGLRRLLF